MIADGNIIEEVVSNEELISKFFTEQASNDPDQIIFKKLHEKIEF